MDPSNLMNLASLNPKTYIWMFAIVAAVVALVNRVPQLRSLVMGSV